MKYYKMGDGLQDQAVTYDDVESPEGRLYDELRAEQNAHFALCKKPCSNGVSCNKPAGCS